MKLLSNMVQMSLQCDKCLVNGAVHQLRKLKSAGLGMLRKKTVPTEPSTVPCSPGFGAQPCIALSLHSPFSLDLKTSYSPRCKTSLVPV